ncbi:hypothetical protein BT63DRAFT_419957 [Microthyrium microscopicum]|uniref:EF-hand domain-containing protein n=1 Tax=Microthyrium microscopicum TaxID=703497 RepID=A0A6A6UUQ3_9PEZI|nr:hypothetical protein BT63DRAFT_419957 [Microthyrium microscopicum]
MSTPVHERESVELHDPQHEFSPKRSGDDDGTVVGEGSVRHHSPPRKERAHLAVHIEDNHSSHLRSLPSPSRAREAGKRLDDDLTMLQVERQVSAEEDQQDPSRDLSHTRSIRRSKSRREEPPDDFDIVTSPTHDKSNIYKPPENPNTSAGKIFKKIHGSSFLVRYFLYITPLAALILIPLLLAAFLFKSASVGGVRLMWFCIWLEIVWLSLWAGRIVAKCLPWPMGLISSLFTNNSKKWRDLGKQLEIPATLFFWGLAFEISFLPTMVNHHVNGNTATRHWEGVMNKVIIAMFVGLILNFIEKIIMQLIAISFHLRTYADRIEVNKFQIASLVKLYEFSKQKIDLPDREFEEKSGAASGTRTPGQLVKEAQKNTVEGFKKVADVAGKIAGDFTGRDIAMMSNHPHQVILTLLATTEASQVLARRLYRTFCQDDTETVHADDLRPAFINDDEADAAFTMFDKDMNGDISMEELESVCVEIGRERKSITASLKDLDSVVGKLNDVFVFVVIVITVLVFISLISTSAAGVLTSAGSTVLALSWLFSATAQEFLQSIIFVFVKHPFDVGDRVSIYGNTGSTLKGDDYFVKEISLLYTEFKKMEGHVVQAPNSYLNTLFILNQRRSGGLAEALPVIIKFGTTLEQIETLREQLLEFVTSEKREYQDKILTELRDVTEAHSITLNIVFFYKSNWQNELLRLQRRNKFICALMVSMQELGIEGPRMRYPGQKESFPVYLQHAGGNGGMANSGSAPGPFGSPNPDSHPAEQPFVEPVNDGNSGRRSSIVRRPRGESLAQMGRRVDFSLGMRDVASGDLTGDVYEDRKRLRVPPLPSPGRGPTSPDRRGVSSEIGRSSSVRVSSNLPRNRLTRVGTDSSAAGERENHRNRFFSRYRSRDDTDVEAGITSIPEHERERLDPRSGTVTPRAWKSNESVGPEVGGPSELRPKPGSRG